MSRHWGSFTQIKLPRAHRNDPSKRVADDAKRLVEGGAVRCTLDVPDAASDIEMIASFTKRCISCCMTLEAPEDRKRGKARVNWLLRQIKDADAEGIHLKAIRKGRAKDTKVPLQQAFDDPTALDTDATSVVPTTFQILDLARPC